MYFPLPNKKVIRNPLPWHSLLYCTVCKLRKRQAFQEWASEENDYHNLSAKPVMETLLWASVPSNPILQGRGGGGGIISGKLFSCFSYCRIVGGMILNHRCFALLCAREGGRKTLFIGTSIAVRPKRNPLASDRVGR